MLVAGSEAQRASRETPGPVLGLATYISLRLPVESLGSRLAELRI